jgi:hypothetical protein
MKIPLRNASAREDDRPNAVCDLGDLGDFGTPPYDLRGCKTIKLQLKGPKIRPSLLGSCAEKRSPRTSSYKTLDGLYRDFMHCARSSRAAARDPCRTPALTRLRLLAHYEAFGEYTHPPRMHPAPLLRDAVVLKQGPGLFDNEIAIVELPSNVASK